MARDLLSPPSPADLANRAESFSFVLDGSSDDHMDWSFWGKRGARRFQGGDDGSVCGSLDAVQIGVDARRGDWLAGIAIANSFAEMDYRFARSVDACGNAGTDEGILDMEILSINPYAGRTAGAGWVWATTGFGTGSATVERCESGERRVADIRLRLGAAGGQHELGSNDRWRLLLVEDVGLGAP